ncbi:MAG: hypothetical protein ABJE95_21335 [Byssovorax sp.]
MKRRILRHFGAPRAFVSRELVCGLSARWVGDWHALLPTVGRSVTTLQNVNGVIFRESSTTIVTFCAIGQHAVGVVHVVIDAC